MGVIFALLSHCGFPMLPDPGSYALALPVSTVALEVEKQDLGPFVGRSTKGWHLGRSTKGWHFLSLADRGPVARWRRNEGTTS